MTAGSISVPTIIPLRVSPGPKHVIDTRTKIELASDSAGTVVFYTLDGTRPLPSKRGTSKASKGSSNTCTYSKPFFLGAGKVTIKAIACSDDLFKESSVVTRTFIVQNVGQPPDSDDEPEPRLALGPERDAYPLPRSMSAQLRHRLDNASLTGIFSGTDTISHCDLGSTEKLPVNLAQSESMLLSGCIPSGHSGTTDKRVPTVGQPGMKSLQQASEGGQRKVKSRPATKEIPKPECLFCAAERPCSTDHKYCTHCGHQLPPLPGRASSPPLQVSLCPKCRSHLPLDSASCLVCEHALKQPLPIPVILAQKDDVSVCKEPVVCLSCGTRNLAGSASCLTCELPLSPGHPPHPPQPPAAVAPLPDPPVLRPVSGSSYMMCGRCGRVNVSDARFCDWCGNKPQVSELSVQCSSCRTTNEWHYRHCYACGNIIKAPLRPDVELSSTMKMPSHVEVDKEAWIPVVEIADRGPELRTTGTQTQGLFFPSSRTIGNQKGSEFMKKVMFLTTQDRRPKLQSCSPGKGRGIGSTLPYTATFAPIPTREINFGMHISQETQVPDSFDVNGLWRVQVEHMVTHLKAYSQASSDFQSAIGFLQMGKLLSSEVTEHEDSADIQLSFSLCQKDQSKSVGKTKSMSTMSSADHLQSQPKRSTRPRARRPSSLKGNVTPETLKLLGELSPGGQGRKDVMKSLIDQGADVNASSSDTGMPVLSLAASCQRVNCIILLVQQGAKLNGQSKCTGNTALHEAVLKGSSSIPVIECLLGHGANPKLRNSSGLTPCDVALKLKHDEVVTCFATYVGAGLIDSLCKHQPSLSLTL